jgi:hypothetical protein
MFALRLGAPLEGARSEVPAPETEVWRDNDGLISALGIWRGREQWLRVPTVGEFVVDSLTRVVEGRPEPGIANPVMEDAFQRIVLPLAAQAAGQEVLHASAVVDTAGVVGFCARSGSGKSTLAWALQRLDFRLFADDALLVEPTPAGPEAVALPFRTSLREPAAAYLGVKPGLQNPQPLPGRAALRALCVLERQSSGPHAATRLEPAQAFTAVLPHAYCFTLADEARKRKMIDAYLDLVASVPVLRISFTPQVDELPQLVNLVASEIGRLE